MCQVFLVGCYKVFLYNQIMTKKLSERIAALLLAKNGGNQSELARHVGVSPQAVQQWLAGETSPRGKNLEKLAGFLGVAPAELQYGTATKLIEFDSHPDLVPVKRVKFKLNAGVCGFAIELDNGDATPVFFRKDWIDKNNFNPDKLFAFRVSGASMEPSLWDGDLVVVDTNDPRPTDGDVFAVNYEGEMVIKRLRRDGGEWWVASDNADQRRFAPKRCNGESLIIGRVVYKQSERI